MALRRNISTPQAPAKAATAEAGEGEDGDGGEDGSGAGAAGKSDKKAAPASVSRKVSRFVWQGTAVSVSWRESCPITNRKIAVWCARSNDGHLPVTTFCRFYVASLQPV